MRAMTNAFSAIQRCQEVLDRTPADHPDWPRRLVDLGSEYSERSHALVTTADLETAIELFNEALDKTPPKSSR